MTILPAGSFHVSDYRKAIPDWVKIVCAIRALDDVADWVRGTPTAWVRALRFDHRPALQDRPYDTEAKDFIPPQNDPDHIEAIDTLDHDKRTFGREPGAEKTVTTRGSDIGEAKHIRKVQSTQALHNARMAMKGADPQALAEALNCVKPRRKKGSIQSRPFPKRQRPLRRSA